MTRVLVTGGAGTIGAAVVRRLLGDPRYDVRDSLSGKLVRLLERELATVARHDPNVSEGSEPLESALQGADAVVIATNHSAFEGILDRLPAGLLLVDPWNVSGSSEVFAQVRAPASVR